MNLENLRTKSFKFASYDEKNIEHLKLLKDITNDNLTQEFFNDWSTLLFSTDEFTYGYIVEKDNNVIGLITINEMDDRNFVFSHIISPNHRGNKYSSLIKKELYDYIFQNNMADNIICYIEDTNKNSISSMMKTNPDEILKDKNNMFKVVYKNKYNESEIKNGKSR